MSQSRKAATGKLPDLRQVLAPNPSAMTGPGTNSWILGRGGVAVIDPGPDLPGHLGALKAALDPGERIIAILVTHAHLDHSALAPRLAAESGAPVLAFGPAGAGRSARMERLRAAGGEAFADEGQEGVDEGFRPDRILADGEEITGPGWSLRALHTPGHYGNHMSFLWQDRAFCGDLVMGWSSTLVSPPEGDMGDYLASLQKLAESGARLGHSGHGADIADLPGRIAELAAHRRARETQILTALATGPGAADELARRIYTGLAPALLAAAGRNVLAHLLDLEARGAVAAEGALTPLCRFRLL